MQVYGSTGYARRNTAKLILEKNIHGLDIDKCTYFTLMMYQIETQQKNRVESEVDQAVLDFVFEQLAWEMRCLRFSRRGGTQHLAEA